MDIKNEVPATNKKIHLILVCFLFSTKKVVKNLLIVFKGRVNGRKIENTFESLRILGLRFCYKFTDMNIESKLFEIENP